MSVYQIRFSVDLRAVDDRSKPRDWYDAFLRLNVKAESFEDAVQKVNDALQALIAGPRLFGILFTDSGEAFVESQRNSNARYEITKKKQPQDL